ncbi:MAG: hypothetical protein V3T00_05650 [bacterium]
MLTPAQPDKSDPLYKDKKEQYRKDCADKKSDPSAWGVVRDAGAGQAASTADGKRSA